MSQDSTSSGTGLDPEDIGAPPEPGAAGSGVQEPQHTADEAVSEGESRLDRSWTDLFATGVVGGGDVSIGLVALVLVMERTGNELIASLAFSIGFVSLTLAGSELITENFLVPVTTVAKGLRSPGSLVRLWSGTLAANLLGGAAVVALFVIGWPDEIGAAVEIGERAVEQGIGLASFARAMLAGALITVMTWMQISVSHSTGGRIVAAMMMGFMIIYTHSNHVVVGAFEIGLAILAGADITWGDLLLRIPWFLLGNLVGGLGLVTILRLVQVRGREQRYEQAFPTIAE